MVSAEPKTAERVSQCGGKIYQGSGTKPDDTKPVNCLFLDEPIGGKPGYDLYVYECVKPGPEKPTECEWKLWNGGAIGAKQVGPLQAVLSYEKGKEQHGSFQLLYNYVGLVYKYLSGVIIGVAVVMVIVGGIQITVSAGGEGINAGKERIIHALMALALWFLASLILYTINPTFFRF